MTDITNNSKAYFFGLLKSKGVDENIIDSYLNSPNFNETLQNLLSEINLSYSNFKNSSNVNNTEAIVNKDTLNQEQKIESNFISCETTAISISNTDTKETTETEKFESKLITEKYNLNENSSNILTTDIVNESSVEYTVKLRTKIINDDKNLIFKISKGVAHEKYESEILLDNEFTVDFEIFEVNCSSCNDFKYENQKLIGTPSAEGVYNFEVTYKLPKEDGIRISRITLIVTQNPKLLWLNKPSDKSDKFWKPDECHSQVNGKQFQMIGASKRGRSHAHVGSFRDDDYAIKYIEKTDWYVCIVSDGAGSCKYSRRGSQLICEAAMNHITSELQNETCSKAIEEAAIKYHIAENNNVETTNLVALKQLLKNELYKIVSYAAHSAMVRISNEVKNYSSPNFTVKDFSSTAIITIFKELEFGTLFASYWVGDGAVGVYKKEENIWILGEVDSGEFSGQTRFLDAKAVDSESLNNRLHFKIVKDFTSFMIMSDGVSDPKFETEMELLNIAAWDHMWNDLNSTLDNFQSQDKSKSLLNWLDFWSKGNHDDRTIVVVNKNLSQTL